MTPDAARVALALRGIVLREVDFEDLVRANGNAVKRGADPIMPMFTPARDARGFAVVGRSVEAPLLTGAVILRACPDGLVEAVHDLSLFGHVSAPGEFAQIVGDTTLLHQVGGTVAVIGSVWRDPDTQSGVLPLLWPILVDAALSFDRVDWIVGLIMGGKHGKLGFTIEGFRHFWEFMTYRDPDWGGGYQVDDFVICAMSRAEALARVLGRTV